MIACHTVQIFKMHNHTYTISGSSEKQITIDYISSGDGDIKPLVIFVHGFKGFKSWGTHSLMASYFAEQGFNFLKFNFSHNGIGDKQSDFFDDLEGFSQNTFSKELFDLNQVITFASSGEQFTKPSEIYLIGHSLGGGISIIQASEDKAVRKLATWASISSFRNLWSPEQENEWRQNGILYFLNSRTNQQMPISFNLLEDLNEHTERLDILAAARKVSQPWLIVHGEADTSVHYKHAIELHNQQSASRLLLLPSADHVFCAKHPWDKESMPNELKQVCDATIAFFKAEH